MTLRRLASLHELLAHLAHGTSGEAVHDRLVCQSRAAGDLHLVQDRLARDLGVDPCCLASATSDLLVQHVQFKLKSLARAAGDLDLHVLQVQLVT